MTLPAFVALITFGSMLQGQAVPQQKTGCKSQIIQPVFKAIDRPPNPSGSFKGYKRFPILVLEIDESGAVENVKIKRSSGSVTADELATGEVRRWKYKPRHGCGIVESQAVVTIDFASD